LSESNSTIILFENLPCRIRANSENPTDQRANNPTMIHNFASRTTRITASVVTTALLTSPALFAQDAPGRETLLDRWVLNGGPTMIFIGLAVVAFIALTIYNFMALTRGKFCPEDLRAALMDHMANCRVRSAIELAASHPSYLGRLVAYSFPNIDATRPDDLGRDQIQDAMADFTVNENRKILTWINYVSVVAQASPMLGLLGTVMGMVTAFGALGMNSTPDPMVLASAISEALLTTLWGLINAIPAIIVYYILKNRFAGLVAETVHAAEEMINASVATVNADTLYAKIPEGIAV
jgi:biopolymer transport protein ExbB